MCLMYPKTTKEKVKKTEKIKTWIHTAGIILFVLILFVGIPILINESHKLYSGYVVLWSAADTLSFYAVILSGIITIIVLAETIRFNRINTETQIGSARSQINVPFFIISGVCIGKGQGNFKESDDGLTYKKEFDFSNNITEKERETIEIVLENVGEGIAISPQWDFKDQEVSSGYFPSFVQKGKSFSAIYDLYNVAIKYFNKNSSITEFETDLTLIYKNTFGIQYEQRFTLKHERPKEMPTKIRLKISAMSHQHTADKNG